MLFENIFCEGLFENIYMCFERDEDRRSINEDHRSIQENPTVQTHDPWGLGSGQLEHTTQVARVAEGGHRPRFSGHTAFMSEPCAI